MTTTPVSGTTDLAPAPRADAADVGRVLARVGALECGPGWYRIVADLDDAIAEVCPGYVLHQVKEKFGGLRFYWDLPELEPACCVDLAVSDPRPIKGPVRPAAANVRTAEDQALLDAWWVRQLAHYDSVEHDACWESLEPLREAQWVLHEKVEVLVTAAEGLAVRTCALCGADGVPRGRGYSVRILCDRCAS